MHLCKVDGKLAFAFLAASIIGVSWNGKSNVQVVGNDRTYQYKHFPCMWPVQTDELEQVPTSITWEYITRYYSQKKHHYHQHQLSTTTTYNHWLVLSWTNLIFFSMHACMPMPARHVQATKNISVSWSVPYLAYLPFLIGYINLRVALCVTHLSFRCVTILFLSQHLIGFFVRDSVARMCASTLLNNFNTFATWVLKK